MARRRLKQTVLVDQRCVRCRGTSHLEALEPDVGRLKATLRCERCNGRWRTTIPVRGPRFGTTKEILLVQPTDYDCPERC